MRINTQRAVCPPVVNLYGAPGCVPSLLKDESATVKPPRHVARAVASTPRNVFLVNTLKYAAPLALHTHYRALLKNRNGLWHLKWTVKGFMFKQTQAGRRGAVDVRQRDGSVVCTVASQQEARGFSSQFGPGILLISSPTV